MRWANRVRGRTMMIYDVYVISQIFLDVLCDWYEVRYSYEHEVSWRTILTSFLLCFIVEQGPVYPLQAFCFREAIGIGINSATDRKAIVCILVERS